MVEFEFKILFLVKPLRLYFCIVSISFTDISLLIGYFSSLSNMDEVSLVGVISHFKMELLLSAPVHCMLDDRWSDVADPSSSFPLCHFLVHKLLDTPKATFLFFESCDDSLYGEIDQVKREVCVM